MANLHWRTRRVPVLAVALVTAAAMLVFTGGTSIAGHDESLPGSDFEIDTDANLLVDIAVNPDTGRTSLDWATVAEARRADLPSGSGDDSFGQGTKEDSPVPSVVSGSIPPNKSDLKTFGVYVEENVDGKFMHLFWARVQDPRGTTNMDFEFNQSSTLSANGVTPVRTPGDLLVVYELSRGGTVPQLFLLRWFDATNGPTGNPAIDCEATNSYPCWGGRTNLTVSGAASGSINTTFIPAANSDGLLDLDPRTFGEASIDLDFVFDDTRCESFGSAYLKSRSSDSFTAALKDFIAPLPLNITNCGSVIIRKQTDPDGASGTFDFTSTAVTDPPSSGTFSLSDDGVETINNVLFGNGYTVTESGVEPGFDLQAIDCSASSGVTPSIDVGAATVTFDIDDSSDVLDCTFTNQAQGEIVIDKVTDPGDDAQLFDFTLTGGPSALNQAFQLADATQPHNSGPVLAGNGYNAAETVPAGWDLDSATCDDGSPVNNIDVGPGETVTCTFTNVKRGTIVVEKQTNPDGAPGDFTFTGDAAGTIQDDGTIVVGDLVPGTYTATEQDAAGFRLDSIVCDDGASDTASSGDVGSATATFELDPGETVTCTFTNSTGAILISKTAKDASLGAGQHPLAGVTFDVVAGGNLIASVVTGDDGTACVDGLVPGVDHTVTETVPDGYAVASQNPQTVTVSAGATCSSGTPDSVNFENDPLSEIEIIFRSLAGPGVTVATSVTCTGPSADGSEQGPLADTESATFTDLLEGVYECTIVVDP